MLFIFILVAACAAFILAVFTFMKGRQFGTKPSGERLKQIAQSPNYRNGQFENRNPTPQLTEGATFFSVMKDFLFGGSKRRKPTLPLPTQKTDLHRLDPGINTIVWFGHSSYFMQVDGKKILVDPVFCGHASPLPISAKSFAGSDIYTADDMPDLDYLIITHDHWDHLDYKTLLKLKPKVRKIITSFGVGAHLEYWGYSKDIIVEGDWNTEWNLEEGFKVNILPARHFSGRGFKRNQSLWSSFVFTTPSLKLYLGGDSGYDTHFAEIGKKFGPFDLAILENGQYNKSWKHIHMMPEEVVQAALDLKAASLMPVHWGKFSLSLHDWDEPIKRVVNEATRKNVTLLHPMIGEAVNINRPGKQATWWDGIA